MGQDWFGKNEVQVVASGGSDDSLRVSSVSVRKFLQSCSLTEPAEESSILTCASKARSLQSEASKQGSRNVAPLGVDAAAITILQEAI
jgi:hypothetical protein